MMTYSTYSNFIFYFGPLCRRAYSSDEGLKNKYFYYFEYKLMRKLLFSKFCGWLGLSLCKSPHWKQMKKYFPLNQFCQHYNQILLHYDSYRKFLDYCDQPCRCFLYKNMVQDFKKVCEILCNFFFLQLNNLFVFLLLVSYHSKLFSWKEGGICSISIC